MKFDLVTFIVLEQLKRGAHMSAGSIARSITRIVHSDITLTYKEVTATLEHLEGALLVKHDVDQGYNSETLYYITMEGERQHSKWGGVSF